MIPLKRGLFRRSQSRGRLTLCSYKYFMLVIAAFYCVVERERIDGPHASHTKERMLNPIFRNTTET